MKNGNYLAKKRNWIVERFTTAEGLFEFFTATAVWYFLVIEYIGNVNSYVLNNFYQGVPIPWLAQYFTYLTISIIFTIVSLLVSYVLISSFNYIRRALR